MSYNTVLHNNVSTLQKLHLIQIQIEIRLNWAQIVEPLRNENKLKQSVKRVSVAEAKTKVLSHATEFE